MKYRCFKNLLIILFFFSNILQSKIVQEIDGLGIKLRFGSPTTLSRFGTIEKLDETGTKIRISFNEPLRKILKKAASSDPEKRVYVDCQLFAQIAGLILSNKLDSPNFSLLKGLFSPESIEKLDSTDSVFAYITASNEKVMQILPISPFAWKGHWLVKDGRNWIGITNKGPATYNLESWVKLVRNNLKKEINETLRDPSSTEKLRSISTLLSEYYNNNFLDDWMFILGKYKFNNHDYKRVKMGKWSYIELKVESKNIPYNSRDSGCHTLFSTRSSL